MNTEIREFIEQFGEYKFGENCIYLHNNDAIKNEEFITICKYHKIKIQLSLFLYNGKG